MTKGKAIANASPLIVLHRIRSLRILANLYSEILIPPQVLEEIGRGLDGAALLQEIGTLPVCHTISTSPGPTIIEWDLGAGESAVIAAATQLPDYELLLDDRAARRCAISMDRRVRETIGVLVLAKEQNMIYSLKEVLDELVRQGFRLEGTFAGKS